MLRLLGSGDSLGLGSRGVCGHRRLVALVVSPAELDADLTVAFFVLLTGDELPHLLLQLRVDQWKRVHLAGLVREHERDLASAHKVIC